MTLILRHSACPVQQYRGKIVVSFHPMCCFRDLTIHQHLAVQHRQLVVFNDNVKDSIRCCKNAYSFCRITILGCCVENRWT